MQSRALGILFVGAGLLWGCGDAAKTSTSNPSSVITGTVAVATYPSPPQAAVAVDENGLSTFAPLGSEGQFSLTLPKGHEYHIAVVLGDRQVPVVYARSGGTVELSFSLETDNARLDLGQLRYLPAAGQGSIEVRTSSAQTTSGTQPTSECASGKNVSTGALCVEDGAKTTCGDGQEAESSDNDDDNNGEHAARDEQAGCAQAASGQAECDLAGDNDKAENNDQGGCVDAFDETSPDAGDCKGQHTANGEHSVGDGGATVQTNADASGQKEKGTACTHQEVAVPEKNPPSRVRGCDHRHGHQHGNRSEQECEH
jgi:hypothetical protein